MFDATSGGTSGTEVAAALALTLAPTLALALAQALALTLTLALESEKVGVQHPRPVRERNDGPHARAVQSTREHRHHTHRFR